MVWAGFSAFGTTELAFVSSRMKSADYVRILQDKLLPYVAKFPHQHFTFQQDNAAIHVSAETTAFLLSKNVRVLPWPARSPDCNPMENVWGLLTHDVYANGKQYDSVDQLKTAILEAWGRISLETCQKLANSMHNRMLDVIAKGGETIDK